VRRVRDRTDRRRVMVHLAERVEKAIVPLFGALGQRMLARLEAQDDRSAAAIREFHVGGARDLREEAARLPCHHGSVTAR